MYLILASLGKRTLLLEKRVIKGCPRLKCTWCGRQDDSVSRENHTRCGSKKSTLNSSDLDIVEALIIVSRVRG
jgi:hypothetical protein